MVQLSHPYLTTGKTIALTIRTFASKVISLLFDMLSRFVLAFLPMRKTWKIPSTEEPGRTIVHGIPRVRHNLGD